MKTVKRLLSAFIFYPLLVLWFIPRQKYLAWKKAEFEYLTGPNPEDPETMIFTGKRKRSPEERKALAKLFFDTEFQIAMAGRGRINSKRQRSAVYAEHLKSITTESQEDEIFKGLGIKDER